MSQETISPEDLLLMQEVAKAYARYAKSSTNVPFSVEDLSQEFFIALMKAWPQYSSLKGASKKTFAFTCIKNRFRNILKKLARDRKVVTIESVEVVAPFDAEQDIGPTERGELSQLYEDLWKRCTPLEKVVLDLRMVTFPEKLSLLQVASCLKIRYRVIANAAEGVKVRLLTIMQERGLDREYRRYLVAAFSQVPIPPVFQNTDGPGKPVLPEIGKPSQMQFLRNLLLTGWFTKPEMKERLSREYESTKGSIVQMTLYRLNKSKRLNRRRRGHVGEFEYTIPVEMTQEVVSEEDSE